MSKHASIPSLDVQSNWLVHISNVSPVIAWRSFKMELSSTVRSKVKFIETFEAWLRHRSSEVVIEFATAEGVDRLLRQSQVWLNKKFCSKNVVLHHLRSDKESDRRNFFERIHRSTGVDLLKDGGAPPRQWYEKLGEWKGDAHNDKHSSMSAGRGRAGRPVQSNFYSNASSSRNGMGGVTKRGPKKDRHEAKATGGEPSGAKKDKPHDKEEDGGKDEEKNGKKNGEKDGEKEREESANEASTESDSEPNEDSQPQEETGGESNAEEQDVDMVSLTGEEDQEDGEKSVANDDSLVIMDSADSPANVHEPPEKGDEREEGRRETPLSSPLAKESEKEIQPVQSQHQNDTAARTTFFTPGYANPGIITRIDSCNSANGGAGQERPPVEGNSTAILAAANPAAPVPAHPSLLQSLARYPPPSIMPLQRAGQTAASGIRLVASMQAPSNSGIVGRVPIRPAIAELPVRHVPLGRARNSISQVLARARNAQTAQHNSAERSTSGHLFINPAATERAPASVQPIAARTMELSAANGVNAVPIGQIITFNDGGEQQADGVWNREPVVLSRPPNIPNWSMQFNSTQIIAAVPMPQAGAQSAASQKTASESWRSFPQLEQGVPFTRPLISYADVEVGGDGEGDEARSAKRNKVMNTPFAEPTGAVNQDDDDLTDFNFTAM